MNATQEYEDALPAASPRARASDAYRPESEPSTRSGNSAAATLRSNVAWLYLMTGLTYIVPVVILPYLVRVLGVERYGLIAVSQAVSQYFVVATDYGFNFSATRAIAQNRLDSAKRSRIFWSVMTIKAFLVTAGGLALTIALIAFPRLHAGWQLYLASYLGVIGNALFPTWLFQGMERMRSISIITGSARLASAALVVLFVHRGADTVLAALLLSSGPLIAGMCGAGVALRLYVDRWVVPRRTDIFAMLREGRHLFLTTAAVSLYSNTNVVLVGLLSGNVEAGYFSLADKLIRAISGLVGPVIQAAYPRVVRLVVESKSAALVFVRKTLFWSAGLASVAGIFLYVAAGPIAILAFAPNDAALLTLIRCLSLFPLLTVITYILATLVMIPFGLDKEQSRWLLAIGFLNLVLGVMVIPHFGALGGVICMIVIEALQSVGALAILLRRGVLTVGPRLNIDFLDPMR